MATPRPQVIVTSFGTRGDVYPFIGLGAEFRRRGYDVVLVSNDYFRQPATDAGLRFRAQGTAGEYRQAIKEPKLWDPWKGLEAVMTSLIPDPIATYETLLDIIDSRPAILISHPFALAPRLMHEKRGTPCVTAVLSTSLFRSNRRVPVMYAAMELSQMVWPFKKAMWALADRFLIDPAVCPVLNPARQQLGLEPIRRPFDGWIFSPQLTVGMFPAWFAPPQPDWPDSAELTGFPLYSPPATVPRQVDAFIDNGSTPVVATCGSALGDWEAVVEAVTGACMETGRRALFVGRRDDQVTQCGDSGQFLAVPFAPFDAVFERCCAVIHHGGIGTTAAALQAGIPQVVRPIAHDHPDHAARIEKLGVGRRILAGDFTAGAVAKALNELLDDDLVDNQCRRRARQIRYGDGLRECCYRVESTFELSPHDAGGLLRRRPQ